jgi:hypothetical protein
MLDAAVPIVAEEVEAQAVDSGFDSGTQPRTHGGPLPGVEETFEDGLLDTLADVLAGFGHGPEAFAPGGAFRTDIVSDEH